MPTKNAFSFLLAATLGAVGGVGCTPVAGPYFAETSSVLKRGAVSITAAGGGGLGHILGSTDTTIKGCCVGVGGRFRVGVGARQEIGAEGGVVWVGSDMPWNAKLSWKGSPVGLLAFIADVGATKYVDYGMGGSLAALVSPKIPLLPLRLYVGARLSVSGPLKSDTYGGGGLTMAGTVPLGLALELPIVHVFGEVGFIGERTWNRSIDDPTKVSPTDALGAYALVGVGVYFGGTD